MLIKKIETLTHSKSSCVYYNELRITYLKNKLENYLAKHKNIYNYKFAIDTLFPQELSFNNKLEGYNDDLNLIIKKVKDRNYPKQEEDRILNLYKGYRYILEKKEITKENIKELYNILSEGFLDNYSQENMGKYYRKKEVYIMNGRLDIDKGIPKEEIDTYMNNYLNYINEENESSISDEFIKSQIMHYYLVYIHPYFDVNGRTSRTIALWYLLNKKAYPYLLFNRAIYFQRKAYKKAIIKANKTGNVTYFLEFTLKGILNELQKVEQINNIKETIFLTEQEQEILEYFLSLEKPTIKELALAYNGYDPHKESNKAIDIIYTLIEKGVLELIEVNKTTILSLSEFAKIPQKIKKQYKKML